MAAKPSDSQVDFIYDDDAGNSLLINSISEEEFQKELQETKDTLFKLAMREAQKNYSECAEFMSANFERMDPIHFYQELFPNNETHEEALINTHYQQPNAVFLYKTDTNKQHRERKPEPQDHV